MTPREHDFRVIAAGPITLQPCSRASRIVMLSQTHGFSVNTQIFEVEGKVLNLAPYFLEHGSYFPLTELPQAIKRFAERLKNSAEAVGSIYREETPDCSEKTPD